MTRKKELLLLLTIAINCVILGGCLTAYFYQRTHDSRMNKILQREQLQEKILSERLSEEVRRRADSLNRLGVLASCIEEDTFVLDAKVVNCILFTSRLQNNK